MIEERRIANPENYDDLIEAFKVRAAERGVSYAQMDECTGLPAGYTGKVFGKSQTKKLSAMSLDLYVTALGLRMVLIEDENSLHAARHMLGNRVANQARDGNHARPPGIHVLSRVFSHIGRRGGRARMSQMSAGERSKHQSNAANARWKKRKAARAKLRPWQGC